MRVGPSNNRSYVSSGSVASDSSRNLVFGTSEPLTSDLERFVGMFDKKVGNRFENKILPVAGNKLMSCVGSQSARGSKSN